MDLNKKSKDHFVFHSLLGRHSLERDKQSQNHKVTKSSDLHCFVRVCIWPNGWFADFMYVSVVSFFDKKEGQQR